MPSCIRAAEMWCSCGVAGYPPAPFVGAPWRKGLMWCSIAHLAFMCFCGCSSSPDGSMHLSDCYSSQSERKIKWQKPTFPWYVAVCLWERLLPVKLCPSCKFTADLQLSAGQFTITLNTLTHTVSWVSIRQRLLSQTRSDRLPLWQLLHQIRSALFFIIAVAFWGQIGLCFAVCLIKSTCNSKIKLCFFKVFSLLVIKISACQAFLTITLMILTEVGSPLATLQAHWQGQDTSGSTQEAHRARRISLLKRRCCFSK